jgi:hypothetical protein
MSYLFMKQHEIYLCKSEFGSLCCVYNMYMYILIIVPRMCGQLSRQDMLAQINYKKNMFMQCILTKHSLMLQAFSKIL